MSYHLSKKKLRILEFLLIGVLFGLIEDVIAVKAVSDAIINPRVILTILAVAVPFAIVSELIVDHPKFWTAIRLHRPEEEENERNRRE
ncbi:MAG: hypothetical protein A2847_02120 [Candidatus Sungbacteria bacterium RIFCSPHIGHO2_01_FULL_50_25]|uniref:Uncharacterized protein n=1 Tax=Candidatus Sungbacteria bacterium RIFCSPHIGHO2_01_FULL_50_25 TaxID=1802265 RepID=A0A1G2K688_9BACT|nr:MAG: hypothetical protein A2847_02120 [Candidatus Sungbacteria bacterium RIFCSPHIGHO2_01_FULL_50_25]